MQTTGDKHSPPKPTSPSSTCSIYTTAGVTTTVADTTSDIDVHYPPDTGGEMGRVFRAGDNEPKPGSPSERGAAEPMHDVVASATDVRRRVHSTPPPNSAPFQYYYYPTGGDISGHHGVSQEEWDDRRGRVQDSGVAAPTQLQHHRSLDSALMMMPATMGQWHGYYSHHSPSYHHDENHPQQLEMAARDAQQLQRPQMHSMSASWPRETLRAMLRQPQLMQQPTITHGASCQYHDSAAAFGQARESVQGVYQQHGDSVRNPNTSLPMARHEFGSNDQTMPPPLKGIAMQVGGIIINRDYNDNRIASPDAENTTAESAYEERPSCMESHLNSPSPTLELSHLLTQTRLAQSSPPLTVEQDAMRPSHDEASHCQQETRYQYVHQARMTPDELDKDAECRDIERFASSGATDTMSHSSAVEGPTSSASAARGGGGGGEMEGEESAETRSRTFVPHDVERRRRNTSLFSRHHSQGKQNKGRFFGFFNRN